MTSSGIDSTTPLNKHREIPCTIIRETDKAILVRVNSTEETEWFPLSQVSYIKNSQTAEAGEDIIHVSEWIAAKKGL